MEREGLSVVSDEAAPSGSDSPSSAGRQQARERPKLPLPTDRMKLETQLAALRAFVTASRNGATAVGAKDVAARIGVNEDTAALVNNFFVAAGFLSKEGKGKYKPVPTANEYARQHSLNRLDAAKQLGALLSETWYYREVARELELSPGTTQDVLIGVLAQAAGVGGERRTQLGMVLDWLVAVYLIEPAGDGRYRLTGSHQEEDSPPDEHGDGDGDDVPAGDTGAGTTKTDRGDAPERGPQVIGFSFDISLTAEDLGKLEPGQIAAMFEAVGKVLAVKTDIEGAKGR